MVNTEGDSNGEKVSLSVHMMTNQVIDFPFKAPNDHVKSVKLIPSIKSCYYLYYCTILQKCEC